MAFADEIKILAKAGNGGNGLVSFRRERYVARGGPDGGNGGNGGSIYLIADHNETSLAKFLRNKNLRANNGEAGKTKNSAGKTGEDLAIKVPVGTQVISFKEDGKEEYIIADLDKNNERFLLAKGGEGGSGNSRFARASFQTPNFADLGEPGEEKNVILRLKMVAEVGIIGLPSAGKSTLISVVSNAKPKIAEYAFTTLVPNLGIVNIGDFKFLMADIPGLIKGAHKGKGLGIEFLKHIERTKVLIHVIDGISNTIKQDFNDINSELKKHNPILIDKPQIIAINKIDVLDDKKIASIKKLKFNNFPVHYISAVTHKGTKDLIIDVVKTLKKIPKPKEVIKIYTLDDIPMDRFEVSKEGKKFVVKGDKVEKLLYKTDLNNPQAVGRMYKILKRIGVLAELKKAGAKLGDEVKIAKFTIEYKKV